MFLGNLAPNGVNCAGVFNAEGSGHVGNIAEIWQNGKKVDLTLRGSLGLLILMMLFTVDHRRTCIGTCSDDTYITVLVLVIEICSVRFS